MRCLALVLAFVLCAFTAWAQSAQTPLSTMPPKLTGFGTVAVMTGSVAVSTVTAGPNSAAYPTPGTLTSFYISIRNSVGSANTLFVCWLGGLCTSAVGEPLAVGEAAVRNLGTSTTAPTVISGGTSTAIVGW